MMVIKNIKNFDYFNNNGNNNNNVNNSINNNIHNIKKIYNENN